MNQRAEGLFWFPTCIRTSPAQDCFVVPTSAGLRGDGWVLLANHSGGGGEKREPVLKGPYRRSLIMRSLYMETKHAFFSVVTSQKIVYHGMIYGGNKNNNPVYYCFV